MAAEESVAEEAPFYVRWGPEHSPYAIELKLELVSKIASELIIAEKRDVEIGGLLIGSVLGGSTPTFRIEDIEMIPRPENGAIFMLGPDQQQRFAQLRREARSRRRAAIGFFRSHCRPGPLKPSFADRTLLTAEFKQTPYVVLLIETKAPRPAAFFVAPNGELPADSSVREFRFNEAEFKALPEVEADPASLAEGGEAGAPVPRSWYIGVGAAAALILAITIWFGVLKAGVPGWSGSGSKQLNLTLAGRDHLLKISWNHDARQIGLNSSATLDIVDGASRRELKLGADELKLGSVEYDRASDEVQVNITVNTPNSAPISESARWSGK
jgi:hypothetical protein